MPTNNNNNKKQIGKRARKGYRGNGHLSLATYVPAAKRIHMTYSTATAIAEGGAGGGVSYFYRLNSVYDPDASGVGTTATGYSTWAALFLNYKVRRVTVRVQGTPNTANNSYVMAIMAPVPSQAVIPTNPLLWVSIPKAVIQSATPNANGGKSLVTYIRTFDIASVAGVTKAQYQNDMDFSGTVGSNPARQVYFFVGMRSIGSGTPATFNYTVQISYEVEWFNPTPIQL